MAFAVKENEAFYSLNILRFDPDAVMFDPDLVSNQVENFGLGAGGVFRFSILAPIQRRFE